METRTVPCGEEHVFYMSYILHDANEEEAMELLGMTGYEALAESYLNSKEVYTITLVNDDKPLMIYGIMPDGNSAGLWMCCSKSIDQYRIPFIKAFKRDINKMKERFDTLYGGVYSKNKAMIRMLEWVGFEVIHGDSVSQWVWRKEGTTNVL